MKTLKLCTYICIFAALISACTKKGDQGLTGLTGATGPVGPKGDTGATGAKGDPGQNGNANVTPSGGISVTDWSFDGNLDWWYAPPIAISTSEPGGIVEVYLSSDNDTSWNAIPIPFVSQPVSAYWTYNFTTGISMVVTVYFQWQDLGAHINPTTAYGGITLQFNVVYIAPSVIRQNRNTNLKNYSEVSKIPGVTFSKNVQ